MVEPSKELQLVFDKSINDAKKLQHEYVTLEHLLYAMFCEENFVVSPLSKTSKIRHMSSVESSSFALIRTKVLL